MGLPHIIPTRTDEDLNSAADINALMENIAYVLDMIHPVGSTYDQYPDELGAFADEERPQELWPDTTWSLIHNTEGVFFRTEGGDAAEDRTAGLQDSAVERITGKLQVATSDSIQFLTDTTTITQEGALTIIASTSNKRSISNGSSTGKYPMGMNFDSGDSLTSNTSDTETRPINRVKRIWKRTS